MASCRITKTYEMLWKSVKPAFFPHCFHKSKYDAMHLQRPMCSKIEISNNFASDQATRHLVSIFTKQPFSPDNPELQKLVPMLTNKVVEVVLNGFKRWETAHLFFAWASNQKGYRHNIYTYNAMASILSHARQNNLLRSLVMDVVNSHCYMSSGALGFLIRCLGNIGLVEEADNLFHQVKLLGLCIPNNYAYNCLLEAISKSSSIELLESRVKEMTDFGCQIDKYTLTPVLRIYCNTGKFDRALDVFNKIDEQGWIDEHVFSMLVVSFSKWGAVDKAYELIERMEERNVRLNEKTFTVLIHGFVKESRVDKALLLFWKMRKSGFACHVSLYDVMIGGLCKFKDLEKALLLYMDMKASGINPDSTILKKLLFSFTEVGELTELVEKIQEDMDLSLCNSVLESFMNNDAVEKAYHLLTILVVNHSSNTLKVDNLLKENKKMFVPDITSFSIVMNDLLKANKLNMALTLLSYMQQIGCKPNVLIYNNLIDGLCKAGRLEESCEVLSDMKESGFEPTHFTLNSMYGCLCSREDVASALDLVRKMRLCGIEPWIKYSTLLVKNLCKHGRALEACKFLANMVDEGFLLNIIPCTAAIDGLMKIGEVDRALALFKDICARGYCPDVTAFNILIKGLSKYQRVSEAEDLLDEMVLKGLTPSVVTYNLVIDGLCKTGNLDKAMLCLSVMNEKDREPNVITYTSLLAGLCAAGRPDEALKLWNEMEENMWGPNRIAFMAIIYGLCLCCRPNEALVYFNEMKEKEMEPDTSVYVTLISSFLSDGSLPLAFKIFEEMIDCVKFPDSLDKNGLMVRDAIRRFSSDPRTSSGIANLFVKDRIPAMILPDVETGHEGKASI